MMVDCLEDAVQCGFVLGVKCGVVQYNIYSLNPVVPQITQPRIIIHEAFSLARRHPRVHAVAVFHVNKFFDSDRGSPQCVSEVVVSTTVFHLANPSDSICRYWHIRLDYGKEFFGDWVHVYIVW